MSPKIISFDLDGTLAKPDLVDRFWFEEVPRLYEERHGVDFDDALGLVRKSYDEIGPEDPRWYRPEYWFDRFGLEEDPYEVIEGISHEVDYFEDALEVLERLYGTYELIIISNAHRKFLDVQVRGIEDYFSRTYSCVSDLDRIKKDTEVYERICDEIGISPENLVHVGDNPKFDRDLPKRIGIRAFLVDRTDSAGDGADVLTDLREILDEIAEESPSQ